MSFPLLLDEMFSGTIAQQLRAKGHDVQAVVADPSLASLPDGQILARAAATSSPPPQPPAIAQPEPNPSSQPPATSR